MPYTGFPITLTLDLCGPHRMAFHNFGGTMAFRPKCPVEQPEKYHQSDNSACSSLQNTSYLGLQGILF